MTCYDLLMLKNITGAMNNFMMLHFHEDFIELNMEEVDNEFLWYLYIDIPYVNGVCVFFDVYFILVEHFNWLLQKKIIT